MSRLVPKFRFDGFSGEWEEKKLGDIVTISKGKGISKNDIVENGTLECIRYGELYTEYQEIIKDIKSKTNLKKDSLVLSKNNDVIIPSSGETYIDIATASCILKDNVALGGDLNILRGKENGIFLSYYLSHVKKYDIAKLAQGIAVVHLYASQLELLNVQLPKPKEQEKISDCLSSLDSLIEVQNKKVEALKAHKKGLMQQLFPSEGETVPKLRFHPKGISSLQSGQRFSGEWEEKELGNIGKVSMCKRILKNQTSTTGDIPFYKIGTFGKKADAYIDKDIYENYKKQYSFPKKGDILISASGTIGRLVVYDGVPAYFQDSNIVWIANDETVVKNSFLYFCYNNVKWNTSDNTIARLYNDNLRSIKITIPKPKEQQKIADCLSSLDSQIEAQNKKVEALKEHKKGLMQQLFVSSGVEV